jgi:hypothetical protein
MHNEIKLTIQHKATKQNKNKDKNLVNKFHSLSGLFFCICSVFVVLYTSASIKHGTSNICALFTYKILNFECNSNTEASKFHKSGHLFFV